MGNVVKGWTTGSAVLLLLLGAGCAMQSDLDALSVEVHSLADRLAATEKVVQETNEKVDRVFLKTLRK